MESRSGDLVLSQGTYVLVQDGASGMVEVITGPSKVSLADTDKPVVYERDSRRFSPTGSDRSIKTWPAADEGQYLVLTNPSEDAEGRVHPLKGKQPSIKLSSGRKINIQGPVTFGLFPGQIADTIDGHQLKSNEYLLIRVYNEKEAKINLKNAVVKTVEGENQKAKLFTDKEIRTGNLLIIKGTDVSFYIPPTGIEVLEDRGNYTRNAVTLERLEYCILLDQNGDKRYLKGPDVIFPKPTETFVENNSKRIFRAIELNENMGLYIKVIADYEQDEEKYIAGQELFITGKEQKIYFPRAEHAIIKYGDEAVHYATAVPKGEGRYILNKTTGDVSLSKGPKMLLPNPMTEVIVKRVLNEKTVRLWFPGNKEALAHNENLADEFATMDMNFGDTSYSNSRGFMKSAKQTLLASTAVGMMADEMERKTNYTKPRTIKLDTKYDGAVLLNIWPNFAVQVVNKTGERKVIEGPKVVMLAYDESLEALELSTGKPKTDHNLMKTAYLQTKNNIVSDIITVETKDLIDIEIRLSYKVDFEGDIKKWFGVSNYVKLLTQHMRSVIRNAVKKITVEDFNDTATDVIRNLILGESIEGKRKGRSFAENGMNIYDVEVLNLRIGDEEIAEMLIENQHSLVEQNLKITHIQKDLEYTTKLESVKREKLDEELKTSNKKADINLANLNADNEYYATQDSLKVKRASANLTADVEAQEKLDGIAAAELKRKENQSALKSAIKKERTAIEVDAIEKEMAAIAPKLIEALITSGNVSFANSLAKNLKADRNGLDGLFSGGGFSELLKTAKGSPLEGVLKGIMEKFEELKSDNE